MLFLPLVWHNSLFSLISNYASNVFQQGDRFPNDIQLKA